MTNRFTSIPNDILDALLSKQLTITDAKILLVVARQTYGWHKEMDAISVSQFVERGCGVRRNVVRHLKQLVTKRALVTIQSLGKTSKYAINPQVDEWLTSDQTVTGDQASTGDYTVPKLVTKQSPTKEIKKAKQLASKKHFNPKQPNLALERIVAQLATQNDAYSPDEIRRAYMRYKKLNMPQATNEAAAFDGWLKKNPGATLSEKELMEMEVGGEVY